MEGNLIAWKRVYVPNPNRCAGAWFSWTPTHGQHDLVAAILTNGAPPIPPNNVKVSPPNPLLTETSLPVYVP